MKRVAVGALVLAVGLAFAARAVLAVPTQVHEGGSPSLAARIVGAADDLSYRGTLRLAAQATAAGRNGVRIRGRTEAALTGAQHSAQAANLLGVLALGDAAADPSSGSKYAAEAASAFGTALRLDPSSEDAKFNLELLLTLKPKAANAATAEQSKGHGKHTRGAARAKPPSTGY